MTDWMLQCDGCGERFPAIERLRGTGVQGLIEGRHIAAGKGWTHGPGPDEDRCPNCTIPVARAELARLREERDEAVEAYDMVRDAIVDHLDPPEDDIAEEAIMVEAIRRAAKHSAELESANRRLAAVEALHQPVEISYFSGDDDELSATVCDSCNDHDSESAEFIYYPCPTARAALATGEGEDNGQV